MRVRMTRLWAPCAGKKKPDTLGHVFIWRILFPLYFLICFVIVDAKHFLHCIMFFLEFMNFQLVRIISLSFIFLLSHASFSTD